LLNSSQRVIEVENKGPEFRGGIRDRLFEPFDELLVNAA
jgi:hypothetical protein